MHTYTGLLAKISHIMTIKITKLQRGKQDYHIKKKPLNKKTTNKQKTKHATATIHGTLTVQLQKLGEQTFLTRQQSRQSYCSFTQAPLLRHSDSDLGATEKLKEHLDVLVLSKYQLRHIYRTDRHIMNDNLKNTDQDEIAIVYI